MIEQLAVVHQERERRETRKKMERNMIVETWLKEHHRELYIGATRHSFIISIRDGTIDLSSFNRWLGQDYLFVRAFVPFVASVLIKASKESDVDMEVILGGMASLYDELEWFNKESSKWGVSVSETVPLRENQKYCRFLESLMSTDVEYAVAITAFWAIETVYQQSFAHCLEEGSKTPEELKETCRRWGNDGFGQYCSSLQKMANRCLEKESDDVRSKAEVAFLSVLEHEIEFWNMSCGEA